MSDDADLIIIGGNGASGRHLIRQLASAGRTATIISRRPFEAPPGFKKLLLDLNNPGDWKAPQGSTVVSLLPLWILPSFLPNLTSAKAIIATGSTSCFSKSESSEAHERDVSEKLLSAEATLRKWAESHAIAWTILRPTLIYDGKTDINVARMARFIKRWHFLPIATPGNGLRQPIHTADVAKAVLKSIDNPSAASKAFNIAGGETLTYRAMAEKIFVGLGQKPRFISLPTPLLQKIFRLATKFHIVKEYNFGAGIFQRMNEDLVFEVEPGLMALDYQPRPFSPNFID